MMVLRKGQSTQESGGDMICPEVLNSVAKMRGPLPPPEGREAPAAWSASGRCGRAEPAARPSSTPYSLIPDPSPQNAGAPAARQSAGARLSLVGCTAIRKGGTSGTPIKHSLLPNP